MVKMFLVKDYSRRLPVLASFLNVEQTVNKFFKLFTAASVTDPELEFTVKPRIISRLFNPRAKFWNYFPWFSIY
jgi:hypothetical protein